MDLFSSISSPGSARFELASALQSDEAQLRRAVASRPDAEQAELVAKEFESIFINMMLSAMRKTAPMGGLIGEGLGAKTYSQLLDNEYAKVVNENFDFNFHDALVRQILAGSPMAPKAAEATHSENQKIQSEEQSSQPQSPRGDNGKETQASIF